MKKSTKRRLAAVTAAMALCLPWSSAAVAAAPGTKNAEIDEEYIPAGGDYQLWVTYNAYDKSGKLVESVTDYSGVVSV